MKLLIVTMLLVGILFTGNVSLFSDPVIPNNIEDIEITISSVLLDVPEDGDLFWISVSTSFLEASWDFGSYDFFFTFDPALMTYQDVSIAGTLAEQGTVGVNQLAPGILRVIWFSLNPLVGEGDLVHLQFQAIASGTSILNAENFRYSDGATHYTVDNINSGEATIYMVGFLQVEDPTIEPDPGFYPDPILVTLETTTEDAQIYYTLDGEEPVENESLLYSIPFELTENATVKAKAFKQDWIPSETVTGIYYINGVVPTAIISVETVEVDVGEIFEIEINTGNLAEESNIFSLDFTLSFDDLLLDYIELFTEDTMLEAGTIEESIDQNGNLEVSWSDTAPLSGEGTLLKISFSALDTGVSELSLTEFHFNDELYDENNLQNGTVTILPLFLPAPENVVASIENQLLSISWDDVEGATLYRIYGSPDPYGNNWELLQEVSEASEWQIPVTADKKFFRVTAATE